MPPFGVQGCAVVLKVKKIKKEVFGMRKFGKTVALLAVLLLAGGLVAGAVVAKPENQGKGNGKPETPDPHTTIHGVMITTYQLEDGYLTVNETFRSGELLRIYGVKEIYRIEKFWLDGNATGIDKKELKKKVEPKTLQLIRDR